MELLEERLYCQLGGRYVAGRMLFCGRNGSDACHFACAGDMGKLETEKKLVK